MNSYSFPPLSVYCNESRAVCSLYVFSVYRESVYREQFTSITSSPLNKSFSDEHELWIRYTWLYSYLVLLGGCSLFLMEKYNKATIIYFVSIFFFLTFTSVSRHFLFTLSARNTSFFFLYSRLLLSKRTLTSSVHVSYYFTFIFYTLITMKKD